MALIKCGSCRGHGTIPIGDMKEPYEICQDCDGEGQIEWRPNMHQYEAAKEIRDLHCCGFPDRAPFYMFIDRQLMKMAIISRQATELIEEKLSDGTPRYTPYH